MKIKGTCSLQPLNCDEEAALNTLTSHVNARVAALNLQIEQMDKESLISTLIPYSISRSNQLHLGHYEDARVVLLGLEGAGKTTLLRALMKAPHVPDISPTNGYCL
ncbi:hypothetical protein COOONC_19574 [Cooperia oncophora]